jgi:hypothetical protein
MRHKFLLVFSALALVVFLTVYGNNRTHKSGSLNYETPLRLIGHKVLLSAGDNTSRVMPIKKLSEHEFQIRFENPVSLEPDSIVTIVSNTIKLGSLPEDYTANVLNCSGIDTVYSFVMSKSVSDSMIPCIGRTLPEDCYYINIAFSSPRGDGLKKEYIMAAGLLSVLLTASFFALNLKKKRVGLVMENEGKMTDENSMRIGSFLFFPNQRLLDINGERIELTDKESKLLSIFASKPNEIIEREKIQKEVWENEGVIVTRSLDVFISKLRKKLEKDNNIKLVNIHGKGYKLAII